MARQARPAPDLSRELALGGRICGVDEAGRGPLAGPVVAAAVILDPDDLPEGLADSKTLSAARRETLRQEILERALAHAIGVAPVKEIDSINILQATMAAMRRAVSALLPLPDHALVDGNRLPADLPCPATAVIKGDALSLSVAAASILAKQHRDALMRDLDRQYPHYGWAQNMGYGTRAHLAALQSHGPCPEHRRSFAPVRAALARETA